MKILSFIKEALTGFWPFPDHRHYLLTRKGAFVRQPRCLFAGHGKTIRVTAQGGSKESCGTMMLAVCTQNGQFISCIGAIHFCEKTKITTAITVEQVDKLARQKRWDEIGLLSSSFPVHGSRNAIWLEVLDVSGNVIL
jgi:hypothetical protein